MAGDNVDAAVRAVLGPLGVEVMHARNRASTYIHAPSGCGFPKREITEAWLRYVVMLRAYGVAAFPSAGHASDSADIDRGAAALGIDIGRDRENYRARMARKS
jgi:hypothetical protein